MAVRPDCQLGEVDVCRPAYRRCPGPGSWGCAVLLDRLDPGQKRVQRPLRQSLKGGGDGREDDSRDLSPGAATRPNRRPCATACRGLRNAPVGSKPKGRPAARFDDAASGRRLAQTRYRNQASAALVGPGPKMSVRGLPSTSRSPHSSRASLSAVRTRSSSVAGRVLKRRRN